MWLAGDTREDMAYFSGKALVSEGDLYYNLFVCLPLLDEHLGKVY